MDKNWLGAGQIRFDSNLLKYFEKLENMELVNLDNSNYQNLENPAVYSFRIIIKSLRLLP